MSKINSVGFTAFYPRVESRQRFGNTIPISSQVIPPEKQQNENAQMQSGAKSSSVLKWGAVLGGIAIGAGICVALFKGRGVQAKQLAENIMFKPAKTIEEAREFAKTNFGIKKFKVKDLEIANYVNEGFTNASNVSKGKIVLPKVIEEKIGKFDMAVRGADTLLINPNFYIVEQGLLKNAQDIEIFKKLGFLDKLKVRLSCEKKNSLIKDKFHYIYHELGHINHRHQNESLYNIYGKAGTGFDIIENLHKTGNISSGNRKHFSVLDKREILEFTGQKISNYALLYPGEYVAEVYGLLMSGKKLPKAVMDLYYGYGGPKIGILAKAV